MTIKEIRANKEIAQAFINYFKDELEQYGEYLLGEPTNDYIFDVFQNQGYWSGIRYNFSFIEELGMIEAEERYFGK